MTAFTVTLTSRRTYHERHDAPPSRSPPLRSRGGRDTHTNGVFDGHHIGIVWDDANGDARFALADPRPQRITSGVVLGHGVPRIAFDGSIYFVAWIDPNNALVLQRISRDGDLIGVPLRVAEHANAPAITAAGSGAALVWQEPGYSLRGAIVSRDGSVATGGPIVTNQWEQRETQVAWNGQRYLILYRQFLSPILPHTLGSSELRMIVLDAGGNPITAPTAVPIMTGRTSPAVRTASSSPAVDRGSCRSPLPPGFVPCADRMAR